MDWLDPRIPIEWLADALDIVRRCPELRFLCLSKRPELWKSRLRKVWLLYAVGNKSVQPELGLWVHRMMNGLENPTNNVWLGVSVENQKAADERRESFKAIPAVRKFVSYEPALEDVNWSGWEFVNQIIFGGESGPHKRQCAPAWAQHTLEFCRSNDIAFFCKQDSHRFPGQQGRIPDDIFAIKQFPKD
jgi:protein gp37